MYLYHQKLSLVHMPMQNHPPQRLVRNLTHLLLGLLFVAAKQDPNKQPEGDSVL